MVKKIYRSIDGDESVIKTPTKVQNNVERKTEDEQKKQEEERQKKIEQQKSREKENINSALNLAEDGFDEVSGKLSLVFNILSEDILLDNVAFRSEEIQNIKNQISLMNK